MSLFSRIEITCNESIKKYLPTIYTTINSFIKRENNWNKIKTKKKEKNFLQINKSKVAFPGIQGRLLVERNLQMYL